MRALVTGGAGFIGSNLVDRLLAEGYEVDVVDDLSTGSLANLADARGCGRRAALPQPRCAFARLRRPRRPPTAGGDLPPGRPGGRPGLGRPPRLRRRGQHPRHDPGPRGCRAGGTARRSSSPPRGGTFYGEPDDADLPVDEHQPHRPLSPYGVSKKSAIDYLVAYRELHGIEFTALALANVYGPRQDPHGEAGVVAIFAGNLLAGRPCVDLRGRQPDPGLRLCGRRRGRLRPGGTARGRAGAQHRHRQETSVTELYEIVAAAAGSELARPSWRRPGPASCNGAPSTRGGRACTSAGSRGPRIEDRDRLGRRAMSAEPVRDRGPLRRRRRRENARRAAGGRRSRRDRRPSSTPATTPSFTAST